MAAVGSAFAIVFTFYQPLALQRGATQVGGFFMGFAAAVVFTRVVLGGVIDRWGRRRMGLIAMTIYVFTIAAMTGLQPSTLPYFGLAFGTAHGLVYPSLNALALENARPGDRGRVVAWINGGFQAGFAVSALGAGLLAQRYGYASVFTLGVLFSLVAWTMLYRRRETVSPSAESG
jgi:MFS family permease